MIETIYVSLTIKFQKEGRRWTAECIELGTATFGRSLKEADKKITEAIELHLNTLEDIGERERFFKEHNIQVYRYKPKKQEISLPIIPGEEIYFKPLFHSLHRSSA